jgi:hypothetical protein
MKNLLTSLRAHSMIHVSKFGFLLLAGALFLPVQLLTADAADFSINVWWPTDSAHLTGVQPFKAMIPNVSADTYDMVWSVDGGQKNAMATNTTDSPHKEASVDVTAWNWHGSGPYVVTFTATQNGGVISTRTVSIYVDNGLSTVSTPTPITISSPATTTTNAPTTDVTATTAPLTQTSTASTPTISAAPIPHR